MLRSVFIMSIKFVFVCFCSDIFVAFSTSNDMYMVPIINIINDKDGDVVIHCSAWAFSTMPYRFWRFARDLHETPLCTCVETLNILNSVNLKKHAFESSLINYGVTQVFVSLLISVTLYFLLIALTLYLCNFLLFFRDIILWKIITIISLPVSNICKPILVIRI